MVDEDKIPADPDDSMSSNGLTNASAHKIIQQVFPKVILQSIASEGCESIAESHQAVSIIFTDIPGMLGWEYAGLRKLSAESC
mmetsp:Transcript_14087/g.19400  ORF Transcript_14087/g.19400 Transcript_14087/m.19400 type:complete len:83 (-) Transcript_14087:694-942(-)